MSLNLPEELLNFPIYVCDVCGSWFSSKIQYVKHTPTHYEECGELDNEIIQCITFANEFTNLKCLVEPGFMEHMITDSMLKSKDNSHENSTLKNFVTPKQKRPLDDQEITAKPRTNQTKGRTKENTANQPITTKFDKPKKENIPKKKTKVSCKQMPLPAMSLQRKAKSSFLEKGQQKDKKILFAKQCFVSEDSPDVTDHHEKNQSFFKDQQLNYNSIFANKIQVQRVT
ncbi:uncharacterized protein [Clytia hemisphaerica]|uniref:C2H2-type domain-containing protein n=1 Tax=Clytia hemisphaerica TaxID=252671 RepID=A0A7M5WUF9_9CNID|eukprot:TCONS_00055467-protein